MYRDPRLIVKLEARCHTYEDALKLQSMLADFVSNNELAGEHIDECEILYVNPITDRPAQNAEKIAKKIYDSIEDLDITS